MKEDREGNVSRGLTDDLCGDAGPVARAAPWKTIRQFRGKDGERVTLWLDIAPSRRSFGMGDAFAVADCWREGGKWVHDYRGKPTELQRDYITHWAPKDASPTTGPRGASLDWWRG